MTGDVSPIAAAADLVAQASYLTGEYRISRRFAVAAYRIYRRRGDRNATCMILAILAGTAQRLGRGAAALAHSQRSYALAREIGEPALAAVALGNLSQALTMWGRYEEAVACGTDAIRLMEEHQLTRNRNYVTALNTLGLLYVHLYQDAMAETRFQQALAIADEAEDAPMQSMLRSNLGLLCWRYRNWKKGLPLLREALEIAHRSGNLVREGEISLNIARGLIELGQSEEAMTTLVRAFMLARRSGNRELEWLVATAESRLLEKQNRLDESARSAERALSIAMEFGSNAYRMVAMHTSLDAELVVLSACDTGQGRIAADGVLGPSRSFIMAGARSVMATLWKLPDDATRLLIEHFYECIAVHSHKARALQEAMLHVKAIPDYATPYYWAGFVLIGHHAETLFHPVRR